jgi:hypothetical protein
MKKSEFTERLARDERQPGKTVFPNHRRGISRRNGHFKTSTTSQYDRMYHVMSASWRESSGREKRSGLPPFAGICSKCCVAPEPSQGFGGRVGYLVVVFRQYRPGRAHEAPAMIVCRPLSGADRRTGQSGRVPGQPGVFRTGVWRRSARDGPEVRPDGRFRRTKAGERPSQVLCRPFGPILAEIHLPSAPP